MACSAIFTADSTQLFFLINFISPGTRVCAQIRTRFELCGIILRSQAAKVQHPPPFSAASQSSTVFKTHTVNSFQHCRHTRIGHSKRFEGVTMKIGRPRERRIPMLHALTSGTGEWQLKNGSAPQATRRLPPLAAWSGETCYVLGQAKRNGASFG